MTDYPSYLPCPAIAEYKGTIDYAYSSVTFNRGNSRRRTRSSRRHEKYDLTFILSTRQLWQFQLWAQKSGFAWTHMPLVTAFNGIVDQVPLSHACRIISDLQVTAVTDTLFKVKLSVELDPLSRPLGVVELSRRWIIAKTPASPSAPDWIIAKTPVKPSSDTIVSGTPAVPSA